MRTITAAIIITALLPITASATIYRCQVDGRTVFSNLPCGGEVFETTQQKNDTIFEGDRSVTPPQSPVYTPPPRAIERPRATAREKKREKYDLTHRVSASGRTIEVSGRVTGPRCDSLRIHVFARNDKGNIIECVDMTSLSGLSTTFSCQARAALRSTGRSSDWFVSSIYPECQDY